MLPIRWRLHRCSSIAGATLGPPSAGASRPRAVHSPRSCSWIPSILQGPSADATLEGVGPLAKRSPRNLLNRGGDLVEERSRAGGHLRSAKDATNPAPRTGRAELSREERQERLLQDSPARCDHHGRQWSVGE